MAFTRTPCGLAEKWRFHSVPTIWVEGPTDIYFYLPIIEGISCRIEPFHGAENAEALIHALKDHDYPYLVILDGDYKVLKTIKAPHRWALILARYSFENFLWEHDAVNRACLRHARCGDSKDLVNTEMVRIAEHFKKELLRVVAFDIAARRSPSPPTVLPQAIEQLAASNSGAEIDQAKVATLIAKVEPQLAPALVKVAQTELEAFLATRCVTHILNGHLILSTLRRLFLRAAENECGTKSGLTNDAFTQLVADAVWRHTTSDDHKRLKRSLRKKARELLPMYSAQAAP